MKYCLDAYMKYQIIDDSNSVIKNYIKRKGLRVVLKIKVSSFDRLCQKFASKYNFIKNKKIVPAPIEI